MGREREGDAKSHPYTQYYCIIRVKRGISKAQIHKIVI